MNIVCRVVTSYKDSIVTILHIQNSIILIQTTEYNNFMLEWEQKHPANNLNTSYIISDYFVTSYTKLVYYGMSTLVTEGVRLLPQLSTRFYSLQALWILEEKRADKI